MTAYECSGARGVEAGPGSRSGPAGYDAVVLAGGAARRLGGVDKPSVRVGGRTLLDRVLRSCADACATVVVAEPAPVARPVTWAGEDPPGAGPLAALEAGARCTEAERIVVLSADLPFVTGAHVHRLLDALAAGTADGVLTTDAEGREQPLVAVYRGRALRHALTRLRREHRVLDGLPLRVLTASLAVERVKDPVASFDCDTWDDIARARARIREHGLVLDEWISAVEEELGVDLDVDAASLLDLARDAAHGVARPAAPLTTFLVGYAAARSGGGPLAVAEAVRAATALARSWADEGKTGGPADPTGSGTLDAAPSPALGAREEHG
ncbi:MULTISPECIES: NTP transferase domain-containing protein [unclassified Streptomyces]|uniref:NTP transferase domain-containing protein n=1 Tax=unclassified Streptomyces TaxID=2593676 RepID=UPI0019068547|nr:NTP transferase domain-containing protein [Streptomyces sp. HSG2]